MLQRRDRAWHYMDPIPDESSRTVSEIVLPADLLLGTAIMGPQSANWHWDQPDGTVEIKAVSGISHAEPAALAALAAWADYQRAKGLTLRLDDSLKSPYAW